MTKLELATMFAIRNTLWSKSNAEIAEQFPHVWESLCSYIQQSTSATNVRLKNLIIQFSTDSLEYVVVAEEPDVEVSVRIPLDLVFDESSDVDHYLKTTPDVSVLSMSGDSSDIARRRQLVMEFQRAQAALPGLFVDIPGMLDVDDRFQSNQVFKGEASTTLQ